MAIVARFGRQEQSDSQSIIRDALCTIVEQVGDVVYLMTTNNGYDVVRSAIPSDYTKLPGVGIIIDKASDVSCRVQWLGETPSLYSGLEIGKMYFLDTSSQLSLVPPVPVTEDLFVQVIGIAVSASRLFVKPDDTLTKRKL
jgi:hypothetical protein